MLLGLATPIRVSLDRFELLINVGKLLFTSLLTFLILTQLQTRLSALMFVTQTKV